jgi:hypothetical protein
MKKTGYMTVYWGDEYGKPPKTLEERVRDEALAIELLQRAKTIEGVKVREFRAPVPRLPGYEYKEEVQPSYLLQIEGQQAIETLLDLYQPAAHLVSHFPIWKVYTSQELESAPLLRWWIKNQAIEDDYYDLHEDGYRGGPKSSYRRCGACRAELEQVRDLVLNKSKMGRRELSLTYSFEIILSEHLAQCFREAGLTGFALRPVQHYRKPYANEPVLYQLVVTHTLPPMASPPTEFERVQQCSVCGTTTRYLKHTHFWGQIQYYEDTDMYYLPEVLGDMQDFNRTAELFGDLPDGHPLVLISQRVYRLLREQRVKGWEVVPVYLTEGAEG